MQKKPASQPKSIDGIHPRQTSQSRVRSRISWRINKRVAIITGIGCLLVILVGVLVYVHFHRAGTLSDSASLQDVETRISKHYVLPIDEVPALATVTDKTKLSTNFFKGAMNGDRILLYQKNRLAVIYRPSIDRVVAVGPISIDTPPTAKNN